tara:strand:+ start:64854 stop:65600 length:747 start_codon:yes stop_codon:yes gene_type:complete
MSQGHAQRSWGLRSRLFLVIVVLGAGLAVHWLLFAFVSISIGAGPREPSSTFDVAWVESRQEALDEGWADSALLFDAEPLFLPTEWNSASDVTEIARLRDATELFPPFSFRIGALTMSAPTITAGSVGDLPLISEKTKLFRLFLDGGPDEVSSLQASGVHVRIHSLSEEGAQLEITEILTVDVSQAPPTLWNPLEYVMILDPAFGAEMPLKLSSSGSVEWDDLLTEALSGSPVLEGLPYGYYRVYVAE